MRWFKKKQDKPDLTELVQHSELLKTGFNQYPDNPDFMQRWNETTRKYDYALKAYTDQTKHPHRIYYRLL